MALTQPFAPVQTGWTGGTTTLTITSVDGTGCAGLEVDIDFRNVGSITINSVTYGGNAMTRVGTDYTSPSPAMTFSKWVLPSPPTGSNSIVITASAAIGGAGNDGVVTYKRYAGNVTSSAAAMTGDDQHIDAVSPFTSVALTMTTVSGDLVSDTFCVASSAAAGVTASGTQTGISTNGGGSSVTDGSSYLAATTASTGVGWAYSTAGGPFNASYRAIVIKAAAAGSGSLLKRGLSMTGGMRELTGGMNS